jgi:hypothetical protein
MHGRNKRSRSAPLQSQASGRHLSADRSIDKMSTLVQWVKFDILDVNTQDVVFDRLLTSRGDDDAAFKNAATFLEREILQQDVFKYQR